jgi:hypothetical protein
MNNHWSCFESKVNKLATCLFFDILLITCIYSIWYFTYMIRNSTSIEPETITVDMIATINDKPINLYDGTK